MNALPIIIGALCVIAISYRYYSAFIAAKVLALDDSRPVPSQTMYDGHNYYPTNKWVLFGHHFAAISGRGAVDWTSAGGAVWISAGIVVAGDWSLSRRRRARFHDHGRQCAPQRQVAGGDGAHGDQSTFRDWSPVSRSCSSW